MNGHGPYLGVMMNDLLVSLHMIQVLISLIQNLGNVKYVYSEVVNSAVTLLYLFDCSCLPVKYNSTLPTSSIIITYHNEERAALLRTITRCECMGTFQNVDPKSVTFLTFYVIFQHIREILNTGIVI